MTDNWYREFQSKLNEGAESVEEGKTWKDEKDGAGKKWDWKTKQQERKSDKDKRMSGEEVDECDMNESEVFEDADLMDMPESNDGDQINALTEDNADYVFFMEIDMGNDAVQDEDDLLGIIQDVSGRITNLMPLAGANDATRPVRDANGNTVGSYGFRPK